VTNDPSERGTGPSTGPVPSRRYLIFSYRYNPIARLARPQRTPTYGAKQSLRGFVERLNGPPPTHAYVRRPFVMSTSESSPTWLRDHRTRGFVMTSICESSEYPDFYEPTRTCR
jgi:hypothetical protein